jgi:hypothetical protein
MEPECRQDILFEKRQHRNWARSVVDPSLPDAGKPQSFVFFQFSLWLAVEWRPVAAPRGLVVLEGLWRVRPLRPNYWARFLPALRLAVAQL